MKTTNLFKAVAFVAMTIVSVMNTEVKAQENNFITNEEVKNELVVAKTSKTAHNFTGTSVMNTLMTTRNA